VYASFAQKRPPHGFALEIRMAFYLLYRNKKKPSQLF
jgi:hypothetical protein